MLTFQTALRVLRYHRRHGDDGFHTISGSRNTPLATLAPVPEKNRTDKEKEREKRRKKKASP